MPYVFEKGPYFEIAESLLADVPTRITLLGRLRDPANDLAPLTGADSPNLDAGPYTYEERLEHLYHGWFGYDGSSLNGWVKHLRSGPDNVTGDWEGYVGDPESIMREAVIRAIEVSLGIAHSDDPEDLPDPCCLARTWPIDMYWVCQGPWFQCFVLWRHSEHCADDGHVTIVIATPAMKGFPLTTKITRPVDPSAPPYRSEEYASPPPPLAGNNRRGLWVVGHEDYTREVVCQDRPTAIGDIVMPQLTWVANDPTTVVCVAPAEWEGGVLHDSRPYTGNGV
jgi:hypothetical protein